VVNIGATVITILVSVVTTGDGEMFVGMNVDEIGVVTITLDSK
jgi:hypothetical protein